MKTSTSRIGLRRCLPMAMLLGALGASMLAHADDLPETAGADLSYFNGSWLCTIETGDGTDAKAVVGTLHFSPWDAWTVGSFSPTADANANAAGDANATGAFPDGPPANWPPHGGHGPAVNPPHGGSGSGAGGGPNNLTFFTYDPVAKAYVSFKFLGTGTYAMASSAGPDANGDWVWEGALSDDGKGTGALVRSTMSLDPNAFSTVGTVSADVGQTWTAAGQARCVRQDTP